MIVTVGSKNASKLRAVEAAFSRYFKDFEIKGIAVESGVNNQPLSLEETIKGAENRAKAAWEKEKCDYAVGLEAGLFQATGTKTGYLDTAAIAIFDGKEIHLGLTPAFEYPKIVVDKVTKEGKEVSDVFLEEWNENVKDEIGAIGRLTIKKVPRNQLQEMGVIMALAPIVNKKYYK